MVRRCKYPLYTFVCAVGARRLARYRVLLRTAERVRTARSSDCAHVTEDRCRAAGWGCAPLCRAARGGRRASERPRQPHRTLPQTAKVVPAIRISQLTDCIGTTKLSEEELTDYVEYARRRSIRNVLLFYRLLMTIRISVGLDDCCKCCWTKSIVLGIVSTDVELTRVSRVITKFFGEGFV